METTFVYHRYGSDQLELHATLNPSATENKKGLILYFHGGGLIYGQRNDLPKLYVEMLNQAGYSLLSLDYPLVPEIRIDSIFNALIEGINNLKNIPYLENEMTENIIYFGRSAGAYLALQLANIKELPTPKKIISFYGYYSLEDPLLNQSSLYYKSFPAVPFMDVHSLIKNKPLTQATIQERFPIYLSYRQTGRWVQELLGRKNDAKNHSLTKEELKAFPPTFIAASQSDQDVPFSINQQLEELIPETKTYFINELPHDFDANYKLKDSIACYESLINWLN